jgi:hypothetical protein
MDTQTQTIPIYRKLSASRREGVLTLTPGRSAVLDRAALRQALLAEGAA